MYLKKSFKIKKSVVESMVDDAIRSMLKEGDEKKEAQSVEDMKRKVKSLSQKVSNADEELPELRNQISTLKNKLSTMKEGLDYEDGFNEWLMDSYGIDLEDFYSLPEDEQQNYYEEYDNTVSMTSDDMRDWQRDSMMLEAFKSQKLKNFARRHGGLKNGKWSADFKNDLYNMSDEDFDTYKVVNQNDHYRQYGLNGWDTNGYGNNNFQPIEFGDGTFMVKKNPELRWDDRAKDMMDKQIDRRNSRRNDGKNEYQFENPYLNDKFNQEYHVSKPRGSWGYGTDWKLEPSNINMTALRSMEGYDKYPGDVQHGDVAAKAKALRKSNVSESKLNTVIQKFIKKVLNEGIYDYPDGIDSIIFLSENDRELYKEYRQIAKACMKLYKKDVQLTLERLMESSIMKKYQQHCFKKYAREQQGLDRTNSPREFRRFIAEKIIDEVVNGAWDDREMMNESLNEEYVWWGNTKPLETIYSAAQEIVNKYGSINPEDDYESTAIFDLVKWANDVMDEADKYIHYEAHNTAIGESKLNEENEEQPKQYGYQNVPDEFVEKVGENGYGVWVPDWALCYLVNGDTECMDDEDIAKVDKFVETYQDKVKPYVGDCCIPMDGEEPSFRYENSIDKLGADCYRFFLPAK